MKGAIAGEMKGAIVGKMKGCNGDSSERVQRIRAKIFCVKNLKKNFGISPIKFGSVSQKNFGVAFTTPKKIWEWVPRKIRTQSKKAWALFEGSPKKLGVGPNKNWRREGPIKIGCPVSLGVGSQKLLGVFPRTQKSCFLCVKG
jgi:hypothetical protein